MPQTSSTSTRASQAKLRTSIGVRSQSSSCTSAVRGSASSGTGLSALGSAGCKLGGMAASEGQGMDLRGHRASWEAGHLSSNEADPCCLVTEATASSSWGLGPALTQCWGPLGQETAPRPGPR